MELSSDEIRKIKEEIASHYRRGGFFPEIRIAGRIFWRKWLTVEEAREQPSFKRLVEADIRVELALRNLEKAAKDRGQSGFSSKRT